VSIPGRSTQIQAHAAAPLIEIDLIECSLQVAGRRIDLLLSAVHQHRADDALILKNSAAVPYPSSARPTLPKAPGLQP
jgi:hypothetical protein